MKNLFYKTLFFSIIALLLLVLFQTTFHFFELKPLVGVTAEVEKPKLTLKNYIEGSYQEDLEAYSRDNLGFREWLIRGYNQFLWSCFRKTNNKTIRIGKEDWLFEDVYVRDHYQSLMYDYTDDPDEMREILEREALRLWKVQEILKEYDIHIFVNIPPGKDVIYPEYLPENSSYTRPVGLRAYDYYKKRFDELGIQYIDNIPVFKKLKDSVDYPLFPQTGIHWSSIVSVHVFDSIIRYMEDIGNQNLNNISIGEKYMDATRSPDNDLEQLLNLVFPIKSRPNYYAEVKVLEDSTAVKPYFTIIGDSFHWNFIYSIPLLDIFKKVPYWYYNYIVYGDENHTSMDDLDIEQELMRTDYIMLNYGTVPIYQLGSCFLSNALVHLCYDKSTIDSVAEIIIQNFKEDPKEYASMVEESKAKNQSLYQTMYGNAIYMITMYPERFFKELRGEKLPVSRNKNLKAIRKSLSTAESSSE